VGELGDLLELLYGADSSWRTLRLTAEEWWYWPPETTTHICLWASADGRRRTERDGPGGSYRFVFDGRRCWTYTPEFGAVVHESQTMRDDVAEQHLDSVGLIRALDLALDGDAEIAGRPALRVRGRPRQGRHAPGVPQSVEEVLLHIDAERGIVLSSEGFIDRQPVSRFVVSEIAYDEEFPPTTFVYEPPPGETVRTQDEAFRVDYVSLEEAAQHASFTVWRPRRLAAGWRVFAIHRPRSERPALEESVHLLFHDDATHSFTIEQAAMRLLAWRTDDPEVVMRDGLELRVWAGERPGPSAEVQLEREGTHLRLSSDSLDASALVELAATLVPASPEPPPLLA
jgi:outer membrane lipoprotein-sorting protein